MGDWEERVSDMGRFDYVDLHSDRGGALKMYTEGLQEYLKRPSFENLVNMWGPLSYSKRPLRIWPNNRKAIEAHHKIEQKAKKWGTSKRRGAAAETAYVIEEAVSSGRLDPEDEEPMKRLLLGIGPIPGYGPVRYLRFYAEFTDAVLRKTLKTMPLSWIQAFFEFWRGVFTNSAQQLGAAR